MVAFACLSLSTSAYISLDIIIFLAVNDNESILIMDAC